MFTKQAILTLFSKLRAGKKKSNVWRQITVKNKQNK